MIYIYFPPKILLSSAVLWFSVFVVTKSEVVLSDCEIERLLKPLLTSPNDHTIQAQALRQRLANLIRQGFNEQADNGIDEKRSISSLARWNALPNTKRNVQALARSGYLNNLREDNDNDSNFKRDIFHSNNNNNDDDTEQLDEMQQEESKRGIQSLARNGELPQTRQQIEELLDELYEKRNIGSLARDYNFPSYGKRFLGSLARNGDLRYNSNKRNIASILRNGKPNNYNSAKNNYPYGYDELKRNIGSLARNGEKPGKRNVAALLRQDNYLNRKHEQESSEDTEQDIELETESPSEKNEEDNNAGFKRNIASIKSSYKPKYKRSVSLDSNNYRRKRQADYYDDLNEEYLQPVYQNQNSYYDDLINELGDSYPTPDKRFLGSVARSGWPSSLVKYSGPEKRHIGALARLGWLPSLRTVRRFNRSGRSTNYEEYDICRQTSSNGQNEKDTYTKTSPENKRIFLIPAADNVRVTRFPMGPRNY